MIRALLRLLFPPPPLPRHRFTDYVPPVRRAGETLRLFRARQVDAVLARSETETGLFI